MEIDAASLGTVAELLAHLGYSATEQSSLSVLLDGARRDLAAPLAGARTVEILIAIGGG
jgi:hypothetical protein